MNIQFQLPWKKKKSLLSRIGSGIVSGISFGFHIFIGVSVVLGASQLFNKFYK